MIPTTLCGLALLAAPNDPVPPRAEQFGAGMDRQERASESLAHNLLDLSMAVRDGDWQGIERAFHPGAELEPLPQPAPAPAELDPWAQERRWLPGASGPPGAGSDPLLVSVRSWHQHFTELEDVRFKVKSSSLVDSDRRLEATLHYSVVGRTQDRNREWLRGSARAIATPDRHARWKPIRLTQGPAGSLLANTELFDEVGAAAGVAAELPPWRWSEGVFHGACAGDLDRDGWLDIVATGPAQPHVYLNQGDGSFVDRGAALGLASHPDASAPLLLDWDNDGDLDLFLSAVGPVQFYENRLDLEGRLGFRNVTRRSDPRSALGYSALSADVDGDGFLDIYVTSYNRYGKVFPDDWSRARNGTANLLFMNQRDGTFREQARDWGVDDSRWSYAAAFADLNRDGRVDLYVANDFGENALFINRGNIFEDRARDWGVLDPGSGMGVSFGDVDNDGALDLHVTNMSSTAGRRLLARLYGEAPPPLLAKLAAGNSLYRRLAEERFEDWTGRSGGLAAGWAWGGGFVDFDNDGWQDLYLPAGFVSGTSMHDT